MLVEVKKTFNVNRCNDCPYFKEVVDTSCCYDSFDEPNYDWYCANKNADNNGSRLENYNNEHGQSLGGAYHRNVECKIPDWCPFKNK